MYSHYRRDWKWDWMGIYIAYTMQIVYFINVINPDLNASYFTGALCAGAFTILHMTFFYNLKGNREFILIGIIYAIGFVLSFFAVGWLIAGLSGLVYLAAFLIRNKNHGWWQILSGVALLILLLKINN